MTTLRGTGGPVARVRLLNAAIRASTVWLLLALAAAVVSAVFAPLGLAGGGPALVVLTGLLGAAVGCAWLSIATAETDRHRLLTVVAVSGAVAAGPDMSDLVMLVPLVAVGQIAMVAPWRRATALTAMVCLVIAAVHAVSGLEGQNSLRFATLPVIGLGAGVLAGQHVLRVQEAERLLTETRRANEEQARAATLAERARLAREIHDVLAHSLGALTAQLGAADTLLETSVVDGQTHPALQHVRQARRLAAEGLQETRRGIAALRDEPLELPDLLQSLADTYRADQHMPATLTVTGAVRPLPADVGLAVYRTAQEALSNVRRHASGAEVRITLTYTPGGADLTIVNDRPGPSVVTSAPEAVGGGFGLIGMRERAALLSGTLAAQPTELGWTVQLSLPVEYGP